MYQIWAVAMCLYEYAEYEYEVKIKQNQELICMRVKSDGKMNH